MLQHFVFPPCETGFGLNFDMPTLHVMRADANNLRSICKRLFTCSLISSLTTHCSDINEINRPSNIPDINLPQSIAITCWRRQKRPTRAPVTVAPKFKQLLAEAGPQNGFESKEPRIGVQMPALDPFIFQPKLRHIRR